MPSHTRHPSLFGYQGSCLKIRDIRTRGETLCLWAGMLRVSWRSMWLLKQLISDWTRLHTLDTTDMESASFRGGAHQRTEARLVSHGRIRANSVQCDGKRVP
eukprot:767280-Hanusia_phi.AAC.1